MGNLCIEELDIAFIYVGTYQIGPPNQDSTYGMLGGRFAYYFF